MMLKPRKNFFTPAVLAPGGTTICGTTVKFELERTWPIEEIIIILDVLAGSTGPTFNSATTNAALDNILGILKRFNLTINDGAPRTVVDFSGAGLLEYASLVGLNLDRATLASIALSQGSSIAANMNFRIAYRIPLVLPMVGEPLRTRMLLPCHTFRQNPVVTLDVAALTDWASSAAATSVSTVQFSYMLVRRKMPDALDAEIQSKGGYIPCDLIETPTNIGTGVSGEQRIAIPTPGQYANLMFRQYLGGSTVSRAVLDQVNTVGSESRWRLESGGVVDSDWRWKHLQTINDWSRVANGVNQTYSPNFAGAVASGTSYQPAASTIIDYLTDGLESANELGSLLNCELPANTGLRMELIGPVASVATTASTLFIGGHRFFGNLSPWQVVRGQ